MVEQVNPPPYAQPRVFFGKLMPKPEDKEDKKKKAAKKAAKKDGPPIKPIKWEDGPPRYVKHTLHYMNEARQDIVENIFPLNLRGDQGNPGVAPCIIKEVYFPPEAPQEVATLIESALVYQNSSNFEMAIKCFTDSKEMWTNMLKGAKEKLKIEQELFYELSIASVYESSGKDDLALNTYMKAKSLTLPYTHPDKAFAFCGLGSVLFHMEEPAWALRLYLQARTIREDSLGGDTVDTATVYNNLGCCMYMLERNQEAKAYFELANAILECELGPQHERTLTSARNISKANKTVLGIVPEYRPLWTTALPHPAPKSKKKKKKKGKKKK